MAINLEDGSVSVPCGKVGVGGRHSCSCAVHVDLQAVASLESSIPLAKGLWHFEVGFQEREGSIFSNRQHFSVFEGCMEVASPFPMGQYALGSNV